MLGKQNKDEKLEINNVNAKNIEGVLIFEWFISTRYPWLVAALQFTRNVIQLSYYWKTLVSPLRFNLLFYKLIKALQW